LDRKLQQDNSQINVFYTNLTILLSIIIE